MEIDITNLITELGLGGMILYLVTLKLKDIEERIKELNNTIREIILKNSPN